MATSESVDCSRQLWGRGRRGGPGRRRRGLSRRRRRLGVQGRGRSLVRLDIQSQKVLGACDNCRDSKATTLFQLSKRRDEEKVREERHTNSREISSSLHSFAVSFVFPCFPPPFFSPLFCRNSALLLLFLVFLHRGQLEFPLFPLSLSSLQHRSLSSSSSGSDVATKKERKKVAQRGRKRRRLEIARLSCQQTKRRSAHFLYLLSLGQCDFIRRSVPPMLRRRSLGGHLH